MTEAAHPTSCGGGGVSNKGGQMGDQAMEGAHGRPLRVPGADQGHDAGERYPRPRGFFF